MSQGLPAAGRALPENEVKQRLRQYGIPVPDFTVLSPRDSLDELEVSFPAVLKVCSPDIVHKTDVGGVRLGIPDWGELGSAVADFRQRFPGLPLLVEPLAPSGLEMIAGLTHDSQFGLAVMVGMGGVFTEIYRDVAFRLVPIEERDALDMLEELRAHVLFEGFRGMTPDRKAVIRLLLTLSKMGLDYGPTLRQMDLNPVLVYEEGLMVVDAKLILGD